MEAPGAQEPHSCWAWRAVIGGWLGLGALLSGSLPPSPSPLVSLFFRSDTRCSASEVIRFPQPHRALWQPGGQWSLTGMMGGLVFALNKPLQGSSKVCCACGLFFQKILLHVVPVWRTQATSIETIKNLVCVPVCVCVCVCVCDFIFIAVLRPGSCFPFCKIPFSHSCSLNPSVLW